MRYIRITHLGGQYREELDEVQQKLDGDAGFILHMLQPRRLMTADEIMAECDQYAVDHDLEDKAYTREQIEVALQALVLHELAAITGVILT